MQVVEDEVGRLILAPTPGLAGKHQDAASALEAGIAGIPPGAETLLALGVSYVRQGELATALRLIQGALAISPGYGQAWDALGHVQAALGEHMAAYEAFGKAFACESAHLPYRLHCVEAAVRSGRAAELLAQLEAENLANPLSPDPLTALGLIALRERRIERAIDLLEAAVALDEHAAEPPLLLGTAYSLALQPARAAPLLRLALQRDPHITAATNDLAVTLGRLLRYQEAAELLTESIQKSGPSVVALSNLATAKAALGEMQEAVEVAHAAMRLAPGAIGPARAYCNLLPYQEGVSGHDMLNALCASAETMALPAPLSLTGSREPDRPLRIGLLSNLLRTHPVGWLTLAGLEALDPREFSVHCFGRYDESDRLARRFGDFAASWQRIETMDDAAVAHCIRDEKIDILIELGGFGDTGRIDVCAYRPAPLQVKWVGMQYHSTGLPFIDYFLTDARETPQGFESLYREKLLRLPDGYVCYLPPAYAPEVGPLPYEQNGFITFGCLNNLMKLTPATLLAWAGILRRLPNARLLLRSPQFSDGAPRDRIEQFFRTNGISPDRLQLMGRASHREFLATYHAIDLALDPFPYSGGLSTCEALYMGVPVLSLAGEIFAARHSASHLGNVGLSDWVVAHAADYIEKALSLASEPARLAELRSTLRERVLASPLCDAPRFGKNLGQALRMIWVNHCAKREA